MATTTIISTGFFCFWFFPEEFFNQKHNSQSHRGKHQYVLKYNIHNYYGCIFNRIISKTETQLTPQDTQNHSLLPIVV